MKTPNEWIELLRILDRREAIARILEMDAGELQQLVLTLGVRAAGKRETAERIMDAIDQGRPI